MNRRQLSSTSRSKIGLLVLLVPLVVLVAIGALYETSGAADDAAPAALPNISFQSVSVGVTEADTSVSINVRISQVPTQTTTVEYTTLPGTATEGVDYLDATGVLTFTTTGGTIRSFDVDIKEDSSDEPDETVNLVLRNPVNAVLGSPDTAVLTILDDDPTPTSTPSGGTPTPIFVDIYEPNNTLQTAFTTTADGSPLCNITLWPSGDEDFFKFVGKAGSTYEVVTTNLDPGLDTVLSVFDTAGNFIASNDDYQVGNRGSRVEFDAGVTGFYFARIVNQSPSDPADQTYCLEVDETAGPVTSTPRPTTTRVPGPDGCEYNGDFDTSCLIGTADPLFLNFVPIWGEGPDNDFFKLWIKPGIFYTCKTFDLSGVNDTNMILYDANRNGINGNDDRAPGDFASEVSYLSTYTGWLYVLVGPVTPIDYADSFLYTYSLRCDETSPTATPTRRPVTGGFPPPPSPTPFVLPTFPPTPTAFSFETPEPTARPVVQILPLPTATPMVAAEQTINLDLTVYYDANFNYIPELDEGVEELAVSLFDSATGELLAFGFTNEAGMLRFGSLTSSSALRVSIPFLAYSQIVAADSNIVIRIAPWPLPAGIP